MDIVSILYSAHTDSFQHDLQIVPAVFERANERE